MRTHLLSFKKPSLVLFAVIAILLNVGVAFAANPGHGAAVIGAGTFESGNYTFPDTIIATDQIGIGTATPAEKLHVSGGNIELDANYGVQWANNYVGIGRGDWKSEFASDVDANSLTLSTYSTFGIYQDATVNSWKLFMDEDGNFGIGTANPAAKFEVSGFGTGSGIQINESGYASQALIMSDGSYIRIGDHLVPHGDSTYDFGASSTRWRYLYADDGSFTGNVSATTDVCVTGGNCLSSVTGTSSSNSGGWYNTSANTNTNLDVQVGGQIISNYSITTSNGVDDASIFIKSANPAIGLIDSGATEGFIITAGSSGTLAFASINESGEVNNRFNIETDGNVTAAIGGDVCVSGGNCLSDIAGGSMNSFNINTDGEASTDITNGETILFSDSTGITVVRSGNTITFTNTGDTNAGDDLTTSTSWGGDLSGTGSSPNVVDSSHVHAAENITTGTLPSGRLTGGYTGITGVGTLTSGTWTATSIGTAYTDAKDTSADNVAGDVDSAEITDDTINESDLDLTNAPTDNYILSYDDATGGFTWIAESGSGTDDQTLQEVTDQGTTTTDAITIDSNGNERTNIGGTLYINGSSNGDRVGIGTGTPANTLNVLGDVNLTGNEIIVQGTSPRVTFTDTDAKNWQIHANDDNLKFWGNNENTQYVTFEDGGNVGIGTTDPDNTLHVNSSTDNSVAKFESTDLTSQLLLIDNAANTAYFGKSNTLAYIGFTGGQSGNNLNIDTSGNVGIGNKDPNSSLHVTGWINASADICLEDGTCLSSSGGTMSSWTIAGDSGSDTVSDGQTVTIQGSSTIDTSESGRTVTISVQDSSIGNTQLEYDTGQALTSSSNPTFNRVYITDYAYAQGGFHVGGTSDAGTDNLIVDGTSTLTGAVSITGDLTEKGVTLDESVDYEGGIYFAPQPYIEAEATDLPGVGELNVDSFVEMNDSNPIFSKVINSSTYDTYYSDYIPVQPGETLYGEIWAMRNTGIGGTAGTLYYGLERYDKDLNPLSSNSGTTYFVASAETVPQTSTWTKYSGTTTLPTTHSPYLGSDGGPVRYVRVRVLINFNTGTIPTYTSGIILRRQSLVRDSGEVAFNGNVTTATDFCVDGGSCLSTVVDGEADTLATVTARGATTTNSLLIDTDSNGQTAIGNTFYVNGSSNGDYIGISDSTPEAKLDLYAGDSNAGPWVLLKGGGGIFDNTALELRDEGTGDANTVNIDFTTGTSGSKFAVIQGESDGSSGNSGGNLLLYTYSDGGSTANSNQLVLQDDGDVGIGTGTPGYKLTVEAGSAVAANFASTADAQVRISSSDTWAGITFVDSGGSEQLYYNGANDAFTLGGSGSSSGTKRLHVDGGITVGDTYRQSAAPTDGLAIIGKVGIGTNSPVEELQVTGQINASSEICITGDNCLSSTSAPTFVTIDTGNGAMEVNTIAAYTGNQNLGTGNNVDFNQLDVTDYITASGGLHVGGTGDPGTDNLEVDGTSTLTGLATASGGMQIATTSTKGTCDATARGTTWVDRGGAGVADKMYICMKNTADSYEWVLVALAS